MRIELRARRKIIADCKFWGGPGDESLKLIDWYGRDFCRRFKTKDDCGCGGHSRNNKKLGHHGHYMRYSVRQLRRYVLEEKGKVGRKRY